MSSEIDLLRDQIHALDTSINRRLDRQDQELAAIRVQTTKTNSRVTTLETDKARGEGRLSMVKWIPTTVLALLAGSMGVLLGVATGVLH